MFPLHSGDELFFNASSNPHQQYKIPQDLILGHASEDGSNITDTMGKNRQRKSCGVDTDKIPADHNNNNKKMMHTNIERQRRQEMAALYSSLRSLLPFEFIKGKRSISDQMNEAVNYIKHLEKKIKELAVKRNEVKRLSNLSTPAAESQFGSLDDNNISPCSIIVRPSVVGVEIVYNCSYVKQGLPLSRVLKILLDEGFCVVNCVSTRVNERLLHTILSEVDDSTNFNLSELQQKLTQVK